MTARSTLAFSRRLLLTGTLVAAATGVACAQDGFNQMRNVANQNPEDLLFTEWKKPTLNLRNFEYGAWTAPSYLSFSDQNADKRFPDTIRSVFLFDQRAWARWDNPNGQSVYLRARYLGFDRDMAPGAPTSRIFERGFDLDLGYYDIQDKAWSYRFGRQYLSLGRGIAFSSRLDGARVAYDSGQWSSMLFYGRTPPKTTDIDPVVGRSKRDFAGVNVEYKTLGDHRLYGYYLDELDQTDTVIFGQGLRYNARYYAAGAEGPLAHNFGYFAEAVKEGGSSFDAGSAVNKSEIDAHSLQSEVTWRPDRRHHPTASIGYFLGSGDPDRGSVLTSAAGNAAGTPDNAFIGFGRFDSGLALSPRLSNLAVTRLSTTYKFLEPQLDGEQLQLSLLYFIYRKDVAAGPVSAIGASLPNDDVGTGVDAVLAWKPSHDVTLALQASRFDPGDAFPVVSRTDATAIYSSLTYSY